MIVFIIFAIAGYLFFKYLLPMLRSNDPKHRPTDLYNFFDKHPKLFVVTVIMGIIGIFYFVIGLFTFIFGFIFVPCYADSGMLSIPCYIQIQLGLV